MATGASPALDPKADTKTETVETKIETTETGPSHPVTLKQRIAHLLHMIFQGREDHLGWHQ
jgi:hypothetical protein